MNRDPLSGLNPEQRDAVLTTQGPLLVLAGAGTGKTRVVTCRIAHLLRKGTHPSAICAVTFTNKAAREMRERIASLLGSEPEGMVLSTFHSLGLRILREFGPAEGRRPQSAIADSADQMTVLVDALRGVGLSRKEMHPNDAKHQISMWKNIDADADQLLGDTQDRTEMKLIAGWMRYEDEMRRLGLYDFDDLVLEPIRVFSERPEVLEELQARWTHFSVDEYQDTNGCQYEMMKALAGRRRNLCVVGDDDQSIYRWRGADPARILRFKQDWPEAKQVTLDRNYRSTQTILSAANALIANNPVRQPKELKSQKGQGDEIDLYVAEDEADELDWLTHRLTFFKQRTPHGHDDMAVLFRSNAQCRPLEQALRQRSIPYKVVGTKSFFDRREIRDLLAYLRAVTRKGDDQALLRIINTPARGIGKSSIDKIIHWAAEDRCSLQEAFDKHADRLPTRAREGWTELSELIESVRTDDGQAPAQDLVNRVLEKTRYRDHLREIIEDALELEARLKALDDLGETVGTLAKDGGNKKLEEIVDALTLRDREPHKGSEKTKGEGVTLMTMHAAKGLEFPVVFIVGLEDGILPHGKSIGAEDDPDGDFDASLEEERRLFYVGITRAQEKLHLSRAGSRQRFGKKVEGKPSRFLGEIPDDLVRITEGDVDEVATEESASTWLEDIRSKLKPK